MSRSRAFMPLLLFSAACATAPAGVPAPAFDKRVEGAQGMVASSHPDASAAGREVLQAGGNAVDAAVAVAFALGVTDPSQTGLGGAGGMVVWHADTRRADAIGFYARTGGDPDWNRVDTAASRAPVNGRAAGIPGTVAGMLEAHRRWGSLPLQRVLAPAVRLAAEGFTVSPLLSRTAASSRARLAADPEAAALFLPGGEPLAPGARLIQQELAGTIRAIAASGESAFYRGVLAERAVTKLRSLGSPVTLQDWNGYRPVLQRPLCTPWLGYTVLGMPPTLGGGSVLEALNLFEVTGATGGGSPTTDAATAIRMIGAMRVASVDHRRWRGDPSALAVPARGMASRAFAVERQDVVTGSVPDAIEPGDPWDEDAGEAAAACRRIDPWGSSVLPRERAASIDSEPPSDTDAASLTSHFSVVDRDRNAVAATFTVGVSFGSGVYVNGYFLNSGANNFDAATRGTNRYSNSTIAPTIVLEGDEVRLVIGAAGSQYIPTAIAQVTFRTLALAEDPWLAIAAPRFQPSGGRDVLFEPGFSPAVYRAATEAGYRPGSRVGDLMFGGVHAVFVDRKGRLVGVADPRRDGTAAGW